VYLCEGQGYIVCVASIIDLVIWYVGVVLYLHWSGEFLKFVVMVRLVRT
jgi:hypothetical protein